MEGRTVRRFLAGLGYVVHTPASVFGRERLDLGLGDEDWLPIAGAQHWVVFCRDQNILYRPRELKAYLAAGIHMFLLPGSCTRQQIIELLAANLTEICSLATARRPNVYWLMPDRVIDYERSPCFTPATNAAHSDGVKISTGPVGSLLSRTPMVPGRLSATSTQLPASLLRVLSARSSPTRP